MNWQMIADNFLIPATFLLLLALLAGIARFVRSEVWPLIKERMVANNHALLARLIEMVLDTAVSFAEQIGEDNEDKKRLATDFAVRELQKRGINLDGGRLDDLIEAAVFRVLKAGMIIASGE